MFPSVFVVPIISLRPSTCNIYKSLHMLMYKNNSSVHVYINADADVFGIYSMGV